MQIKAPTTGTAGQRTAAQGTTATSRLASTPRAAFHAGRVAPRFAGGPGIRPVAAKTVGSFVPRLTRPAFERYGFSAAALITDWATIVGADVARYTAPERLKWPKRIDWSSDEIAAAERGRPGATLVLAVAAARALDVQYRCAQLVERINSYFGYRAISEIRIVQAPHIKPAVQPAAATKTAPPASKPRDELAGIAEPGLRAALERMAQGVGARNSRMRAPA